MMLICIPFTMSQLANEETEALNWPIAMFEVAYSQAYSIHIIFGTGPGIIPKKVQSRSITRKLALRPGPVI